ncbi:hypothetical protein ACOMHN_011094 [Nucella lapillus]
MRDADTGMLLSALSAISIQKSGDYKRGGQYDSTEQWKKDEILAAKIKKFLSVSHPPHFPPASRVPEPSPHPCPDFLYVC